MSDHQANIQKKQNLYKQKVAECESIYLQLKKLRKHKLLQVSDHAVIRYLERVKGIDIDAVRKEIVNQQLVTNYTMLGDGELPLSDSVRAVVKHGTVITIIK